MQDSIFTQIINRQVPAHKVYEDEQCIGILDIHPINPGHVLLIPKKQVDHLWDLEDPIYNHLWQVSKEIARMINLHIAPPRVGILVEGFGVPHTHIHIVPLYKGDDIKKHQDLSIEANHEELAKMAIKLQG